MRRLCQELNNPESAFPVIHVAGTNGKGSVCYMLDAIFREHGYEVGLFTSPHLFELGERVQVNAKPLAFARIEYWTEKLRDMVNGMQKGNPSWIPSFFEWMTAIAFLEFKHRKVDIAVIETGLGGRLDSTNVVDPLVSVITSIGLDHCDVLGSSLKNIATEKAGIIKSGKPVVTGWLEPEAEQSILEVALHRNAPVHLLNNLSEDEFPKTNLEGSFQRRNGALACKVSELLESSFSLVSEKTHSALQKVSLAGRWQKFSYQPLIILDACHNGHGAKASGELWNTLPEDAEIWFAACGMERASEILALLSKRFSRFTFFEMDQPRACSHEELMGALGDVSDSVVFAQEKDIPVLLDKLSSSSSLLVTGSIYLISSFLVHKRGTMKNKVTANWQDRW